MVHRSIAGATARYPCAMTTPTPTPTPAPNAAILYQPEDFDTRGEKLMGRQAAGESFLKGMLKHSGVDALYCYAGRREHAGHFQRLMAGLGNQRPVHWLDSQNAASPRGPGTLYLPDPSLGSAAWRRRAHGQRLYSLAGITHTIASASAMDLISDLLTAPVQDWDALVCTSKVVLESVQLLLGEQQAYLAERLGATRFTWPQLPVIPLGVDTDDFAPGGAARAAARDALGIGADDVVVLFVGRLSFHAKAHPLPMYLGLERAAQALARQHGERAPRLLLLQVGWFANPVIEAAFRSGAAQFCPSVDCRFVDGRVPAPRQQAWAAADLFTSLSDNVQESFGLTPIEAMAAGLPAVVSDWNGYRDTVRDGVDGLHVPTLMPRAGLGADLADRHAAGLDNYDVYCGSASQFVAIDPEAAAAAYLRLIEDAPLRRRLGAAARQRAIETFDWAVVIPQYQALWAALAERRQATTESATRPPGQSARPARADPFFSFAGYASSVLSGQHIVSATPGADGARVQALLQSPLMSFMARLAPDAEQCGRLLADLERRGPLSVDALLAGGADAGRARLRLERGLVWLAKLGLLHIQPPAAR
jgi:glycosyltransferase involved in cell wall biosynthesis